MLIKISYNTAQKLKFFIKDSLSKCDQICKKLQIWSHLLNGHVFFLTGQKKNYKKIQKSQKL